MAIDYNVSTNCQKLKNKTKQNKQQKIKTHDNGKKNHVAFF